MKIFAFLSLIASLFSFSMGTFILAKNPNNEKNRAFFYLTIITGFLSFFEFQMRMSETEKTAYLWYKAMAIWPFTLSFSVLFIERFIASNLTLFYKIFSPFVHLSTAVVFFLFLFTNQLSGTLTPASWGWKTSMHISIVTIISIFWSTILSLFILIRSLYFYISSKDRIIKKQAQLITIGFFIFILFSSLTYTLMPRLKVDIPELNTVACIAGYFFIAVAMYKYKLFSLTPEAVADQIIETISGALILTDQKGNILFFNKATENLFGINKSMLAGSPVNNLFKHESFIQEPDKFITNIQFNENYIHRNGTNTEITLTVNRISIRDQYKQIQGYVYLANDVSEIKQLKNEKSEAELSDKVKTVFLESLYQEISKPINTIVKSTEMLMIAELPEYEKQNYIEAITEKSYTLNQFIDKIQDIVKIDNKQIVIEEKLYNLNAFIDEIHSKAQKNIQQKQKSRVEIVMVKPAGDKQIELLADKAIVTKIIDLLIDLITTYAKSGIIKIGYSLSSENEIQLYVSAMNFVFSDSAINKALDVFNHKDYLKIRLLGKPGLNLSIIKKYAEAINSEVKYEQVKNSIFFYFNLAPKIIR